MKHEAKVGKTGNYPANEETLNSTQTNFPSEGHKGKPSSQFLGQG